MHPHAEWYLGSCLCISSQTWLLMRIIMKLVRYRTPQPPWGFDFPVSTTQVILQRVQQLYRSSLEIEMVTAKPFSQTFFKSPFKETESTKLRGGGWGGVVGGYFKSTCYVLNFTLFKNKTLRRNYCKGMADLSKMILWKLGTVRQYLEKSQRQDWKEDVLLLARCRHKLKSRDCHQNSGTVCCFRCPSPTMGSMGIRTSGRPPGSQRGTLSS